MTMKEIEGCVERIKKLDINGDGKLDADEYLKTPPVNKYAPGFSIIKALDVNSDKVISAEEIAGAVEALKALDKNKDAKLGSAEYSMASPASMGGEPGGGAAAGGGGGGGGRKMPTPEEFVKQNDKNGDGKVQKSELTGMIVGFFDRMDIDKDGSVTVEEVKISREKMQQNGGGGAGGGRGGPAPAGRAPQPRPKRKPKLPKKRRQRQMLPSS